MAQLIFYTDSTYFSGAEKSIAVLAQSCEKYGHNVKMVVTNELHESFTSYLSPTNTLPTAYRSKIYILHLFRFIKLIRSEKPDAIIVNMWSPYANTLFLLAAKLCQVPTLTIYHYFEEVNQVTGILKPLKLWGYSLGAYFATAIATVSKAHAKILRDQFHFNPKKLSVITNGIANTDRTFVANNHSPRRFLGVGSLEKSKNFAFAISCLESISMPWQLTVVGDGPERKNLEKMARDRELPVVFTGKITNVSTYYSTHDVLIHPSLFENLSMAVIEAMSYGLAVIANDVGGNSEIVSSNTGWLLQANDISQWTEALQQAIVGDLSAMQQAAYTDWLEHFTPDKQYEEFSNVLKQILS